MAHSRYSSPKWCDIFVTDMIKPGDMLRSLLNLICTNLSQLTELECTTTGTKRAFFCGTFTNLPLTQQWITENMACRNMLLPKVGLEGAKW